MVDVARGFFFASWTLILISLGDHAKATAPLGLLALCALAAGGCAMIATHALMRLLRQQREDRKPNR